MMMYHQTKFMQKDQQFRRYTRKSYFDRNDPSLWSWPWNQQSDFLHNALQLMMMYYLIKFSCQNIRSSTDMVETVTFDRMSPHCDSKLEDSKPIFLHDTLAHDVASPNQVWLRKVQQLRRYHQDEHSLEFWTFSVTLTLTTTEQSNLFQDNNRAIQSFPGQSTLWWCTIKQSLVAKGSAVQIIY